MTDAEQDPRALPTGTVTFVRTDVEGSMRLMRDLGASWDAVNAMHMGIIRMEVDRHGGSVVRTGASAGIAILDGHSQSRTALEQADSAMYVRKAQRRHEAG